MEKLTAKQQKIYDYIQTFSAEHGYPPSVREIGAAMGLKSPSTVHFHLKGLEEAGVIIKAEGKTRAITLSGTGRPVAEEQDPHADQIPVVGSVAAGSPILAEECIEDYLTFDTQGLSGEHFALKTLRRRDGKVWLMPANDDYTPIDGDRAEILGKVVAVVRRY